jgi:hypothetical protein
MPAGCREGRPATQAGGSPCGRPGVTMMGSCGCDFARQRHGIIDHNAGHIDAGHRRQGVEFHGVVDFIDQEAALGSSSTSIASTPPPTARAAAHAQVVQLGRDRAAFALPAAGGVGDPVRGRAVDGAHGLVADHHGADIAPGFLDVFLNVINGVLVRAEGFFVFQMASAASRSLILASRRPHEPTVGFSTTGYPILRSLPGRLRGKGDFHPRLGTRPAPGRWRWPACHRRWPQRATY